MAACTGCGAATSENFCSSCGAPVADAQLAPILLDTTGPRVAASTDTIKRGPRPRNIVLGVIILAMLLAGGLTLSQSPDELPEADATEAAEVAAADAEQARAALRSSQSTRASSVPITDEDTVLGSVADWFVVVQSANGVSRIDVNTGEEEDLGLDGTLLGQAWGKVLVRRLNGDLQIFDAEELGGELPVEIGGGTDVRALGSSARVLSGSQPGMAWLLSDIAATAWQVDVSTGVLVRSLTLDSSYWYQVSPDFLSPVAGGVYTLQDDDSYQLALDGRILGEGPGRILVNRCDESLTCGTKWLAPDSFEELPQFFVPSLATSGYFPEWISGGRFLSDGPGGGVLDSETGERHQLDGAEQEAFWDGRISISPDAQVVAMRMSTGNLRMRLMDEPGGFSVDSSSVRSRFGVPPIFVPRTTG